MDNASEAYSDTLVSETLYLGLPDLYEGYILYLVLY